MAIDLSGNHINPGDDVELPTKLNDMMDAVEEGVNGGLTEIDENLDTLSAQITSELNTAVAQVVVYRDAASDFADDAAADAAAAALSEANALSYLTQTQSARDQAIAIVYGGGFTITAASGNVPIADTDARIGNDWLHIGYGFNQIPLMQFLGGLAFYDRLPAVAFANTAPTVASATSIIIQSPVTFVSGTTSIATIAAPGLTDTGSAQITIIPTGLWSTTTAGNIALATTAVVNRALTLTYDSATAKWYPSY